MRINLSTKNPLFLTNEVSKNFIKYASGDCSKEFGKISRIWDKDLVHGLKSSFFLLMLKE